MAYVFEDERPSTPSYVFDDEDNADLKPGFHVTPLSQAIDEDDPVSGIKALGNVLSTYGQGIKNNLADIKNRPLSISEEEVQKSIPEGSSLQEPKRTALRGIGKAADFGQDVIGLASAPFNALVPATREAATQMGSSTPERAAEDMNALLQVLPMAAPIESAIPKSGEARSILNGEVLPPEVVPRPAPKFVFDDGKTYNNQSAPKLLESPEETTKQTEPAQAAESQPTAVYEPDYHFDTDTFGVKKAGTNDFVNTGFDTEEEAAAHAEGLNNPVPETEFGLQKKVDDAASETNTNPTPAQIEAGNYKKGKVNIQGLNVTIENPRGSVRSGIDAGGKPWNVVLPDHYGYIKGTEGMDGEHVDAYIGPNPESPKAFIVDQIDASTGDADEHKVMLGYDNIGQATSQYEKAFSDGRGSQRIGAVTPISIDGLKDWLKTNATKKPAAESLPVEDTAAGKQSVIPGAEKITDKQLAERNMQKPLQSKVQQSQDIGGLFDTEARKQTDLLDMPVQVKTPKLKPNVIPPSEIGKPTSLSTFIRNNGGIKDDGDLVSMGHKDIARINGKSFDDMAELAQQHGYFDKRPAENDFKRVLEDTKGGRNHFRQKDIDRVLGSQEKAKIASENDPSRIEHDAASMSIETTGKTPEQLVKEIRDTQAEPIEHPNAEFAEYAKNYPQTLKGVNQAARDLVLKKHEIDGDEHAVMIDNDTGKVSHIETSSDPDQVRLQPETENTLRNPDVNYTFHHSHPSEETAPISSVDIQKIVSLRGINEVLSHTNLSKSSAKLTDSFKKEVDKRGMSFGMNRVSKMAEIARNSIDQYAINKRKASGVSKEEAGAIVTEAVNRALAKTGIIDYSSDIPATKLHPDFTDDLVKRAIKALTDGGFSDVRIHNATRPIRSKEQMGRILKENEGNASKGFDNPELHKTSGESAEAKGVGKINDISTDRKQLLNAKNKINGNVTDVLTGSRPLRTPERSGTITRRIDEMDKASDASSVPARKVAAEDKIRNGTSGTGKRVSSKKPKVKPLSGSELQAFYKPNRIIKSYGGFDRVVKFHPAEGDKSWSVDVEAVRPDGVSLNEGVRTHSTPPNIKEVRSIIAKDEATPSVKDTVSRLFSDESGSVPIDAPKAIRDLISPTSASEAAARAAREIRRATGEAGRQRAIDEAAMNKYARQSAALTRDAQGLRDFYNYVEGRSSGVKLKDPALQDFADAIRNIYERTRSRLEAMPQVRKMNFVKDYFTHQWKDARAAQKFVNDFVAKQGSEKNLKKRMLPTIQDGLDAGLELENPNPVRAVSRYLGTMNNYISSVDTLRSVTQDLGGKYYVKGMQPEGYEPLIGRNAERIQDAKIDDISGKIIPAKNMQLYAPPDVARIFNRFYSKGFEDTAGKNVYNIARSAVNANTMMELGLSMYHMGTITIQSINQDLGRLLKNSLVGDTKGAMDALKKLTVNRIPFMPGGHLRKGNALKEQYLGLKNHGINLEQIADNYAKANLRVGQDPLSTMSHKGFYDSYMRGELPEKMQELKEQAKKGYGLGLLKSGAEVAGKAISDISHPLFNYYIPAIKLSSFGDLMGDWLRQNPHASDAEVAIQRVRIADLVEDRFGEMNMDNIFWAKWAKQLTGLNLRAPGWDLGLVRQIGGAGKDIYGILNNAARGKKFDTGLLDRPLYMLASVGLFAALNSAMTYAKTGKAPSDQELKDFIAYKTSGLKKTFGKWFPERGVLPGHGKELVNMYPLPGQGVLSGIEEEAKNKIATLPKNLYDIARNKDWKDKPIYDPKSKDWMKNTQGVAQAAYLLKGMTPFSIEGMTSPPPGSNLNILERGLGVKQAGARIVDRKDLGEFLQKKEQNNH